MGCQANTGQPRIRPSRILIFKAASGKSAASRSGVEANIVWHRVNLKVTLARQSTQLHLHRRRIWSHTKVLHPQQHASSLTERLVRSQRNNCPNTYDQSGLINPPPSTCKQYNQGKFLASAPDLRRLLSWSLWVVVWLPAAPQGWVQVQTQPCFCTDDRVTNKDLSLLWKLYIWCCSRTKCRALNVLQQSNLGFMTCASIWER